MSKNCEEETFSLLGCEPFEGKKNAARVGRAGAVVILRKGGRKRKKEKEKEKEEIRRIAGLRRFRTKNRCFWGKKGEGMEEGYGHVYVVGKYST